MNIFIVNLSENLNDTLCLGIGRSPFEAMFGCFAQISILSIGIPHSEINVINTEEDIDRICKENAENQNKTSVMQPAATIESNLELPNIELCNDANNEIFNNTISIDLEATKNTKTSISRQDVTVVLFKPAIYKKFYYTSIYNNKFIILFNFRKSDNKATSRHIHKSRKRKRVLRKTSQKNVEAF